MVLLALGIYVEKYMISLVFAMILSGVGCELINYPSYSERKVGVVLF